MSDVRAALRFWEHARRHAFGARRQRTMLRWDGARLWVAVDGRCIVFRGSGRMSRSSKPRPRRSRVGRSPPRRRQRSRARSRAGPEPPESKRRPTAKRAAHFDNDTFNDDDGKIGRTRGVCNGVAGSARGDDGCRMVARFPPTAGNYLIFNLLEISTCGLIHQGHEK